MTPVITETQRNELRKQAAFCLPLDMHVSVDAAHLLDLLDCADRCAELETGFVALGIGSKSPPLIKAIEGAVERIAELESVLRAVDAALENEFGGFYLGAPPGSLTDVREMLRGKR